MNTEIDMQNLGNATIAETEPVVVQQHRLSSIMPIIVFSYIGVLIRLGLAFLGNNQAPLCAAFWPNFVGCFIMGFVVEQKIHIHQHFAQLYIGLTTGLCGSITTFSGVMYNSCVALFGPSKLDTIKKRRYIYAYAIITVLFIQIVYIILAANFLFLCSPQS
ncbi:unnamed protein product [Rotaria sordida]|uniref:Fluoride ion transporter CrcB n=1 Tax=Rotaria sordida TaxID=392033 RepID=A0A814ET90_9BILA|nr:unnamed protein product [Rotaria sordida]